MLMSFPIAPALALSKEAAMAKCRSTVGKPIVMDCLRGGGGGIEACRGRAFPRVKACVMAALNAANGRDNVPMAIPKDSASGSSPESASAASLVAPPRTIADITVILDGEKPDEREIEQRKAEANVLPIGGESRDELAKLYFKRGSARAQLGRTAEAIADANKALEVGRGVMDPRMLAAVTQFAALQYSVAGDPKKALEIHQRNVRESGQDAKGYQFSTNRLIAQILLRMGDVSQAEAVIRRSQALIKEARTSGLPGWRKSYDRFGQAWESDVELGQAMIAEARGRFKEAENSYKVVEQRKRASMKAMLSLDRPPPETVLLQAIDINILSQARVEARQGRLAEAEVDARRALLSRLRDRGKYNPATPGFISGLAAVLLEQGRYPEAEKLIRAALDVNREIGVPQTSPSNASLLLQLGGVLNLQRKQREAADVYVEMDKILADWEPQRRQYFDLNGSRILTLLSSGQIKAGLDAAERLVRVQVERVGENHFDAAAARGLLAVGLMQAGRDTDAIREFRGAIPILLSVARESADDDDATVVAARGQRLQAVVEAYFALLARDKTQAPEAVARETFALADTLRGRSVQQALVASSVRGAASDPALADVVRREQDLGKQINAQLGVLNNVLSLPSSERDEKGVLELNKSLGALRSARDKFRQEIGQRFPAYADLVSPKSPSIDDVRATLKEGEALLSFYFGQNDGFLWAVPKTGSVAFATIGATGGDIESRIRKLREALEPEAAMISDIPPFDLSLAHELYSILLKPVEGAWKSAKSLIVVTNGALGLLPLSLLPTEPFELPAADEPLFSSYRNVAWLARTHTVTSVPSVTALRTLRQLPAGNPDRGSLVAFGDPYFSKAQFDEATAPAAGVIVADASTTVMRGLPLQRRSSPKLDGVNSADLAMLPRLPDTAEELRSIAAALEADPTKALNLGKNANEKLVKTMSLSGFKVLAFATHGLVPGELNGLNQPALALSSPEVTGDEGDGLLTMEEILGLKLDADWIVLSACNTGTGAGAGAEAASGLGRAFFYAGTRALLVTNWSVHSQSARQLVTDLFKRQYDNPRLSRGEALRQAMMALADGPGHLGAGGKTAFAYAHPLFWAPYTIIGDGGDR
ncbi:CHAT domain-containing protein [Rhodopseudomonas sp.]|uniref:CHAT domain-containing protein n=1 Tax=Rhodopseudomonas sp. TaxID=1078 RepID=UPI0025E5D343|nr:CHAT domain-containing protein [Rhodopseudomonas sp.]